MSSGVFEAGKYELTNGDIAKVRVQPETKTLTLNSVANSYPSSSATLVGRYPLNLGGKRRKPFSARSVTIKFTAPLTGYKPDSPITLPIFQLSTFNAIDVDQLGTYLGTACIVLYKSPETR